MKFKRLPLLPKDEKKAAWEMHRLLWPGYEVAEPSTSKFRPFSSQKQSETASRQWLGPATLPTSLLISYIVWGFSHGRRNLMARMETAKQFQKVVLKLCLAMNGLPIQLCGIDGARQQWRTVHVDPSLHFDSFSLWPRDPVLLTVVQSAWQYWFALETHIVSSSFERPTLTDFIFFALEPGNVATKTLPDLPALGMCIITQIASYLDEHAPKLATKVTRKSEILLALRSRQNWLVVVPTQVSDYL